MKLTALRVISKQFPQNHVQRPEGIVACRAIDYNYARWLQSLPTALTTVSTVVNNTNVIVFFRNEIYSIRLKLYERLLKEHYSSSLGLCLYLQVIYRSLNNSHDISEKVINK